MRAVIQRVSEALVTVDGRVTGQIGKGLLLLLGVGHEDTEDDARLMAEKVVGLRCFADAESKFNLSVVEVGGAILAISQFTLFGDAARAGVPRFPRRIGAA